MKKGIRLLVVCVSLFSQAVTAQEDSTAIYKMKGTIEYGRGISFGLKESTSATAVATAEELSHKTSINPSNMLYGLIPGLQVMQNAGNAWDDRATFFIRGLGTMSNRTPLILVDGFERSINQLSADEIESVTVLKDAVSTSLYGIKGANGVIYIKTKRGQASAPQINFSYQFNFAMPNRLPDFANGYTYAKALNEGRTNDGLAPRYSSDELNAFQNKTHPLFYPNVDWWDEALRDRSYGDNVTFSVKGGGKFVRYYTQLNFLDDRGILQPTEENDGYSTQFKYSRLNIRTNLDIDVTPTTKVYLNVLGNFAEHNRPGKAEVFDALYNVPSGVFPVKTKNNIWGGTSIYSNNPIAYVSGSGYYRVQSRTMFADLSLKQDLAKLVKGLSAGIRVGYDNSAEYWDGNTRNFRYESSSINLATGDEKYTNLRNEGNLTFGSSTGMYTSHFNFEASVNYENEWGGKHKLNTVLLYAMDKSGDMGQNNSRAFLDVVAQAHYLYNGRYAFDVSLSGSASSILEPGHQWGLFPSVGASWLISEEADVKSNWLNLLKLRASYGVAGRAGYGMNLFNDIYGSGNSYLFKSPSTSQGGLKLNQLGMTDLTYEKSHKLNVGVDFMAFNKLSVAVEGFYDHRTDILVTGDNAISSIFGTTAPKLNNGVVDNYGLEASVRWNDKIGNVTYQLGGQFSYNRNKIINQNEEYRPYDYLKRTNGSLGQIFGYEVEGLYKNQEEIDNREVKQYLSEVRPGDLKFKDQNGDKRIDEYDQIALGYNNVCPEIYYSFDLGAEYKGLGFYALFQGVGNYSQVLNTPGIWRPLTSNGTISNDYYENRWTPENTNAKYPRLTSTSSANNYSNNSLWVADASFLKLRTLELYYQFSHKTLRKLPVIKQIKVFARAHDLFSIDGIKLADPESIGVTHPTMAQYTFGINLSF